MVQSGEREYLFFIELHREDDPSVSLAYFINGKMMDPLPLCLMQCRRSADIRRRRGETRGRISIKSDNILTFLGKIYVVVELSESKISRSLTNDNHHLYPSDNDALPRRRHQKLEAGVVG